MRSKYERTWDGERGSALFIATVLVLVAIGLSYSTLMVSVSEVEKSKVVEETTRAQITAESAVELGIEELSRMTQGAPLGQAFASVDGLFDDGVGGTALTRAFVDHEVVQGTSQFGTVNVQFSEAGRSATHRDILITADAYVPSRYRRVGGQMVENYDAHARVEKTVRVALESSSVFDYSYFINNWGWLYASSITLNGNARSNGQFDAGNYQPFINGTPRYQSVEVTESGGSVSVDLKGYMDDNGDGVKNGTDGGIYSSWDIVGSGNVRGMASNNANKHDFVEPVPMPNLNNLEVYEKVAKERTVGGTAAPSSAKLGTFDSGPVWGDDAGESGNLFLVGTAANPIVLDGPVVVRGNLIISGKVTGQGSFYVQGNIYVPNNIEYADPPATPIPSDNGEATTEAWVAGAHGKDMLGLFSKENIVVGDYTDSSFRSNVGGWLGHSLNKSKEDSGEDLIPNTRKGRDGILNTSDDDVLEGDNVWTVDRYTAADALAGAIPPGKSVNDPIPGSGEDIDGDGVFDDTITLADFDIPHALNPTNWGGLNTTYANFSQFANTAISQIDGVLYTNHALAFRTSHPVVFNGSMVSRNEAIVYGGSFTVNHDRRLLGGGTNPNIMLPQVFAKIQDVSFHYRDLEVMNSGGLLSDVAPVPPTSERTNKSTGKVMTRVAVTTTTNPPSTP